MYGKINNFGGRGGHHRGGGGARAILDLADPDDRKQT